MNKKIIMVVLLVIMVATVALAVTNLTLEQKRQVNECKKDCQDNKMPLMRQCNNISNACRDNCLEVKKTASANVSADYKSCRETCKNESLITVNNETQLNRTAFRSCTSNCSGNRGSLMKGINLGYRDCVKGCQDNKRLCKKEAVNVTIECKNNCTLYYTNYTNHTTLVNITNTTLVNITNQTQRCETYLDCGAVGICNNGSAYLLYDCVNETCTTVNYLQDPCETEACIPYDHGRCNCNHRCGRNEDTVLCRDCWD